MNLQEVALKVGLDLEIVSKEISIFPMEAEEIEWKTLEVPEGQEITIDSKNSDFQKQFKTFQPKTLEDMREWVGIPQQIFSRRKSSRAERLSTLKPIRNLTVKIRRDQLHSISPMAKLEDLEPSFKPILLGAAKNLVFGKVKRSEMGTPLYQAAANMVLKKIVPIFFFPDIIVKPNATLHIHPSVAAIFAYRIKIYKGGKIVTPRYSYISFHCHSIEGGIN